MNFQGKETFLKLYYESVILFGLELSSKDFAANPETRQH